VPELPERRSWVLPVFVVPLLLSIPAFFGRVFLYRDILGLIVPQQVMRTRAFAAGRLAQWNPLSYGGTPFLADPGVGTFYPPNLLFSLIKPPAVAATIFVLLHFAIAGLGMYLLLRRQRPLVAAIGAVAWQTSGYLLSMHGMHYACSSVALLPLAVALLVEAAARPFGRWIAFAAAAFAALVFNGELQVAGFAAVLSMVLAGARRLPKLLASLALGASLAAIQLLPTLLFSRETVRASGVPLAEPTVWSLHPARLIEWLVPSPFGVPYTDNHFFGTALLEPGRTAPWAAGLALGGCLVLVVALVQWRGSAAWAWIGGIALLLALGRHTPLFPLLWRFVPLANRFRYPEKYAAIATLALVVLAAQGIEDTLRRTTHRHRWLWLVPLALAGAALVVSSPPTRTFTFVEEGLRSASANIGTADALRELAGTLWSCTLFASALVLSLEVARRRAILGLWGVMATVAAGGLYQAGRLLSWGDASHMEQRAPVVQQLIDARNPRLADRVFRDRCPFVPLDNEGTLLERVRRWEWASGKPNYPSLSGVRDAVGYSPAESADKWRVFRAIGAVDEVRMLRLFGTSHLIRCAPSGTIALEPLPQPLPRVSIVSGKLASSDDGSDLLRFSIVADASLARAAGENAKAELIDDQPELLRIRVSGGGGLLRILDSYADGWTATVDGAPAAIGQADVLWRALPMPPGDHEVVLRFRTPGLVAGAWVSLVALLVLAAILRQQSSRTPGAAI